MQIQLKSLYGAVFGNFELFILSFLCTMVLGCKQYFDRYLLYKNIANYNKENICEHVFKDICDSTAHNMKKNKNIFENLFEIKFPDYSKINRDILRRHDIIHRFGKRTGDNHFEEIILTFESITDVIKECNMFVDNLLEAMKEPIQKWKES